MTRTRLLKRKPPYIIGMTIAAVLILLGFAGLFLPILQGILFITIGLLLLMEYHEIPMLEKKREEFVVRYHAWRERRRQEKESRKGNS